MFIVFTVVMGLLAVRVAYIQIAGHEDLSAAADMQQKIVLDGADARGAIYDRNGTPIVGGYQEYIYVIPAVKFDGETQRALNEVDAVEVVNQDTGYKVFASQDYDEQAGRCLLNNSDAYIMKAARRYCSNQPAVHMMGYVNSKDCSGVSGLELMYEDELNSYNKKVMAPADVSGKLLKGYGLSVETASDKDPYIKKGITTTLDLGLQKKVEQILSDCQNDGAVAVLKADSGEIMAAASTPVFDPTCVKEYIGSENGELINKVVQGTYPPGSVFKIVVAAAALEAGIKPNRIFNCSGRENIKGQIVKCETGGEKGHGMISFKKAFADSCNCAFIQLGQMIGADAIINMADRLGLGGTVLNDFPEEQAGNIMSLQESKGAAIANLAIGQGQTMTTPIQIASMTATIANGGKNPGVKIVSGEQNEEDILASDIVNELQNMMKETVVSGTAGGLELRVSAGAKTGSAESVQNGHEVIHGWITGFVPADNPEYVITVFVENGRSGRSSAGPLFAETANYLYESGIIGNETAF